MEDLEFDKNLTKAITTEERKRQKAYLQSVEGTIKEPKSKKTNWWIAASMATLIGLSGYFALFNQAVSNEELYDTYFSPYENVVEPIVRNQVNLTKKAKIFSQYEQGEYQKAIDGFNQLITQDSIAFTTINFYKANAYLQLKEFEKAQGLLYQVIENENKEWKEESLWYLALISLKLNDVDAATIYLQKLQKQNKKVFKNKEVEDLLNILN
jgi:tetratricopeptide (TPR) repeat protein